LVREDLIDIAARQPVDGDRVAGLPVVGNLQDGGAAETVVGKKDILSELFFPAADSGLQGDPGQVSQCLLILLRVQQGNQARPAGCRGQAELVCELIAPIARPGLWVAESASGDDQCIGGEDFIAGAEGESVLFFNRTHGGFHL
jgi:hypothetical protein